MITLEQAKALTYRQVLHMVHFRNADGTPRRWRVNGKVKTWVRSPERVKVPLKHGLYFHDYLDEGNLDLFCLTADEAIAEHERTKANRNV